MSNVSAAMVKELRELTGAGMMDCKTALVECDGDIEKATDYLRAKGLAKAAKKSGRLASEGAVTSYIHGTGRIGVLVEVNCETDFVAASEDFREFCRDVAMQIAAMSPVTVSREELPADMIERERAVLLEKAINDGKKPEMADKIVDGQINKWMATQALMEQAFIKDDKKTIADVQTALVAKVGENVKIRRFTRFELGEGLEKKSDDFAAEVAAQVAAAQA